MACYFAKPLSTLDIREIAIEIRKYLGLNDFDRVQTSKLLDTLSIIWEDIGFQYEVYPDDSPVFGKGEEAKTDIYRGVLMFKESVLEEACNHKYKRAAFTICHEIGHWFLHKVLGGLILGKSSVSKKPRPFEDPEWQADAFASEFLMPANAVMAMTSKQIRKTFGVSKKCADVRFSKIQEELSKEYLRTIKD